MRSFILSDASQEETCSSYSNSYFSWALKGCVPLSSVHIGPRCVTGKSKIAFSPFWSGLRLKGTWDTSGTISGDLWFFFFFSSRPSLSDSRRLVCAFFWLVEKAVIEACRNVNVGKQKPTNDPNTHTLQNTSINFLVKHKDMEPHSNTKSKRS